jgi:glycosyltransferase involved in cell wall biosynthesis
MGPRPSWEQYFMKAHNRSQESWLKTLLLLEQVPLGSCSALWRRSVFESIGYFDPNLNIFTDHEWYCRFFEKHEGRVLPVRWAVCKEDISNSVRAKSSEEKAQEELKSVRERHKLLLPPVTGKVTIGIPCFNMANYLPDSVGSALKQTFEDLEIIVLDDCSTDNIAQVMGEFSDPRIKFIKFDENRGQMDAQNAMLAMAEGEFFIPLSADDTLDPRFVEKCLEVFKKNPFTEFVSTQTDFIDNEGKDFPDKNHPFYSIPKASNRTQDQWKEQFSRSNVYFGVGMYRTYSAREVGGWDKKHGVISDYEMYLKMIHRENIQIVEEALTHTRITGKNQSILTPEQAKALPQMYADAKKPYLPMRTKVIIATPFYELKGFSPYISSMVHVVKLLTQMGVEFEFWELSGDSYVHRARNTICARFLEDPAATDLFFIDSDMQWNPEALVNMIFLPEDVIGGSYPVKNNWASWTSIPEFEQGEDGKNHPRGRILPDGTALLKAYVVAGGFLRIKRIALEKFKEKYPDLWYNEPSADPSNPTRRYHSFFMSQVEDHLLYGEDMWFSKKMREAGLETWIYPNVNMGHYGVKGWTGNYHAFLSGAKDTRDSPEFNTKVH